MKRLLWGRARDLSVVQVLLPLTYPSLLVRNSQRIQVLRRRAGIVHMAEIHWYEATGIGRREFKIKHFL